MLVIKEVVRCTIGPDKCLGAFLSLVTWAWVFFPLIVSMVVALKTSPLAIILGLALQVPWMLWLPDRETLEPQKVLRRSSDRSYTLSN